MLLKNNTCNEDLGKNVETNDFMFFECPPMQFDKADADEI